MKVFILTCMNHGIASLCIPLLSGSPDVELVAVCLNEEPRAGRRKIFFRKVKKVFKIGLLGALNGIRMRKWYQYVTPSLYDVAEAANVLVIRLKGLHNPETLAKIRNLDCDLGLSLGNGYIPSCFFEIPRLGMINVHTEILPRFQGAQGIIWPIYEGVSQTGVTVHQIDRGIDTGLILKQACIPIKFKSTLRETVLVNNEVTHHIAPSLVLDVVTHYNQYRTDAKPQPLGRHYTTPTFWQFLKMLCQHRKFYQQSLRGAHNG